MLRCTATHSASTRLRSCLHFAPMQVADVLADSKLGTWLRTAADRILAETWDLEADALLLLPRHLLLATMCKLRSNSSHTVCEIIKKLPLVLHGPLLSSHVKGNGNLRLHMESLPPLLAAALNKAHLCGPEVRLLDIRCRSEIESSLSILMNSITSHTSLTSLILDHTQFLKGSQLLFLCQNLPSTLKALDIPGTFDATGLQALSCALWQLNALASLRIRYIMLDDGAQGDNAQAAGSSFVQVCSHVLLCDGTVATGMLQV